MTNIENDDKVLGLTMVSDKVSNITYAVRAQYASDSQESMPVVRLTSNYENETSIYDIKINEINPKRASMKEMFALCCHVDERGICEKGSFGTFHVMKQYMKNAATCGVCEKVKGYAGFLDTKLDWDIIACFMKDEFLSAGLFNQYHDCLRIIDMMDYFYSVFHYDVEEYRIKPKEKLKEVKIEKVSEVVARESFCLGEKNYTLAEWKEFLNRYDSIGDAISDMMKQEMKNTI